MKKRILCILGASLFLGGCQQVSPNIENANDKIMTIGSTTYTKGDEYALLKTSNGANMSVELIRQEILNKEIKRDDKIKKEAKELYDSYKEKSKELEDQIKDAGYKSKEDYIDKVLIPSVQNEKLIDKYFIDAKKDIQKEYKPSLVKIIQCDDEKNAKKALEALQKDNKLEDVYKQYASSSSNYTNEETLITTSSTDLPTRLINTSYSAKKTGVIDEVFTVEDEDSADKSAYVVILVENNYDKILDQIKENLKSNESINEDSLVYYLNKYNFTVHDQDIFDYLKTNNPAFLVEHPELSEEESQSN